MDHKTVTGLDSHKVSTKPSDPALYCERENIDALGVT